MRDEVRTYVVPVTSSGSTNQCANFTAVFTICPYNTLNPPFGCLVYKIDGFWCLLELLYFWRGDPIPQLGLDLTLLQLVDVWCEHCSLTFLIRGSFDPSAINPDLSIYVCVCMYGVCPCTENAPLSRENGVFGFRTCSLILFRPTLKVRQDKMI